MHVTILTFFTNHRHDNIFVVDLVNNSHITVICSKLNVNSKKIPTRVWLL